MGQRMSHAVVGEESMDVLHIVDDLLALPDTRFNGSSRVGGKSTLRLPGSESSRQDIVSTLRKLHGGKGLKEFEGQSTLLFPMSLATLFHVDADLDGRFHKRDVEKMLHRWHKAIAQGRKSYALLKGWKKQRLLRAVSELALGRNTGLLTAFTIRRIMADVNSRSIWDSSGKLLEVPDLGPAPSETPELKSLSVCVLAADHMLNEDGARMAAIIDDNKEKFSKWLWKALTARLHGGTADSVDVHALSALLVILYEDCLDVEQLAFSTRRNLLSIDRCDAWEAAQLNVAAFYSTASQVVALYSKAGDSSLNSSDFVLVADLVAKIFQFRGADLKAVGRYEMKGGIGSGANGVVHLGRDFYSGRRVAIKSFNRHDAGVEVKLDSFLGKNLDVEKTLRIYELALPHRHITQLRDVVVSDEQIHFVYSFCGGGSLFDLLNYRRMEVTDNLSDVSSPQRSPQCSPRNSIEAIRSASASPVQELHRGSSPVDRRMSYERRQDGIHRGVHHEHSQQRENLRVLAIKHRADGLGSVTGTMSQSSACDPNNFNNGPLASEAETQMIIGDLIQALAHLHSKGITHRDIRLQNLLYNSARNAVELADFDTAQQVAPGWDLFDGDAVVGSLYYLTPEQTSRHTYSALSADMWGVGVCMYWLLKGRPPYVADTVEGMGRAMRNHPLEPVGAISEESQKLIEQLLSMDAASRPTAAEVLANPWISERQGISLRPLMTSYTYESPVLLVGPKHVSLAAKLIESILSDAGVHRVSIPGDREWILFCALPEHDIKFTITIAGHDQRGVLKFNMIRGHGLTFVKASRKIAMLWSKRLNSLMQRTLVQNAEDLERQLDIDMLKSPHRRKTFRLGRTFSHSLLSVKLR